MSWLHAARQRFRDFVAPARADRALRDEIAHHLDLEAARQRSQGYDPVTARRRAVARFGDLDMITDAAREERGVSPLYVFREGGMQDLHWAIRSLRKSAGFTALALCTLTLGIGATTVAFTVLDTVLLRPLPFRGADRLVVIREKSNKNALTAPSYPNFVSWRESARSFDGVASAMFTFTRTVWPSSSSTDGLNIPMMGVSQHFFATLGVTPVMGREFTDAENTLGGEPAAMVSYEFWRTEMGARRPLGMVRIGDRPTPVVGVLPPHFRFVAAAEMYTPHEQEPGTVRSAHNYMVIGRLKPGVTLSAARADMTTLSKHLLAEYGTETGAVDADVLPLRDYLVSDYRTMLTIVFDAAVLVLLIACTNLVSAQLARGRTREREIVVRAALGASRARLVRQLLMESGVLVTAGTVLALVFAAGATAAIRAVGGQLMPRLIELSLDMRVLAFASAIAIGTALLVGVYPAVRLANRDAGLALRARGEAVGVKASVWRLLVGFEVAMAVMLLVGSSLLVRTLHNILNSDTGFDSHGIVTVALTPDSGDDAKLDRLLADMRALPGVEGVAYTSRLPLSWGSGSGPVRRRSDPLDRDWPAMAGFRLVSPEYFSVLKQPVLQGRAFTAADRRGVPGVAIITPGIARNLWPGESPIGKTIATNYLFTEWLTVVGVVAEASSWTMPRGSQNEIFVPLAQHPEAVNGQLVAMIRTNADVQTMSASIRAELHEVLPTSAAQFGTMAERIARSAADRRFAMLALTAFGAIALVLAAIGIYGVIWYIVTTRTHEIGIRMALGATAGMVRKEILRGAALMAAGGIAAGTAAGAFATRYLQSTLYGVSRLDPRLYAVGAAIALGTALLAAYVPARRSSRVDPMIAIRGE